MMVRLKSMYLLLGGDIIQLQKGSLFEPYYQNSEESMGLRRKEKPAKSNRRNHSAPNRLDEKMSNIRNQLE
jgi:hypothetical protein